MIDTEKIPLTEADTAAYDSTAQILKAAMAYVNPSIGRMMAVMAKSIELRHMMQYLDQGGVSACGVNNRAIPPEEVIRDLRKRGKGKRAAGPLSEYDEYGKNV